MDRRVKLGPGHEVALTDYALDELARVPGLWRYGGSDPATAETRLGVIRFCLDGYEPHLAAAPELASLRLEDLSGVWSRAAGAPA